MKTKAKANEPRALPTLAECERAIGEKANTWVARCYEISCRIVKAGLVEGEAVYGHWTGPLAPGSYFAKLRRGAPFIPHGWILLKDGRVLDPTRWVFENVAPYLYVGEPPDDWNIAPCTNCGLLKEEHGDHGPADQCDMFEVEKWPYDEGGNEWREAMTAGRPPPAAQGPRRAIKLRGWPRTWVWRLLNVPDDEHLAVNQLFYLANFSYPKMLAAVGHEGVRDIYTAIADLDETSVSWIPYDNANRAKRECGFDRE